MISKTGEYALRAMVYLAQNEGQWILARDIGRELAIPPQFMSKVLGALARAGLLVSRRGRQGGFCLARSGRRTPLRDILAPFERLMTSPVCLLGNDLCTPFKPCPLHDEWPRIHGRFVELLRRTTLADVAEADGSGGESRFPWPGGRRAVDSGRAVASSSRPKKPPARAAGRRAAASPAKKPRR